MESKSGELPILRLLLVIVGCAVFSFATDPPTPEPQATLTLSETHPSAKGESPWATVAFLSENTIAVGLCSKDCPDKMCSLFVARWEGETLRLLAQSLQFDSGVSIYPAGEGRMVTVHSLPPTLYSADLSTSHHLSKRISLLSSSGKMAAERTRGYWKLFRLADTLEPLREGTGDLQSVSDELVVIQENKVMRVERLDGNRLASFPLPPGVGYYMSAGLLGNTRLYVDDCRSVRVVDFDGKTQLNVNPRKGCAVGDTSSSADGRRMMFDFTNRRGLGLQNVLDNVRAITTLGMAEDEDVNREDVRVVDTFTGMSCFVWHRRFPMTYSRVRSAAISPSGEFVAIAVDNRLSIYRLPTVCEPAAITPHR